MTGSRSAGLAAVASPKAASAVAARSVVWKRTPGATGPQKILEILGFAETLVDYWPPNLPRSLNLPRTCELGG